MESGPQNLCPPVFICGSALQRYGSEDQSAERVAKLPPPPEPTLSIPPILLEDDEPAPPVPGPGQKHALGHAPPVGPAGREAVELPAAYGTEKVLLLARDPHWLYVHWDLAERQQRRYNALSVDRHLVVRVQPGTIANHPSSEIHVHPESRHWFIHVERAATQYVAQLGYYQADRQWVAVATSGPTMTPPDTISPDRTLRFATIPADRPLRQMARPPTAEAESPVALTPLEVAPSGPTMTPPDTISPDRTLRFATIPADRPLRQLAGASPAELPTAPTPLHPSLECALAEVIRKQLQPQDWISSMEIAELMRGPGGAEIAPMPSGVLAAFAGQVEGVSSPFGGEQPPAKGFWLNLGAELVLYGATEPDASVTVGGQPVQLQPEGTFSCRFALPEGDHSVTVSALSAQGELRQAELEFRRRTDYRGEVGAAPQDPALKPPGL